jgi:ATP-dependent DNA ligase
LTYYKIVIFRVLCRGESHLNEIVSTITENGGEGVILRKLQSLYESGRSAQLLKVKVSLLDDQEGIIVNKTKTDVSMQLYVPLSLFFVTTLLFF